MKVEINNQHLKIYNINAQTRQRLKKFLSYRDKSKEYQLRRLANNPFNKNKPFYKKLESEIDLTLYNEENNTVNISSAFCFLFKGYEIVDKRQDTGDNISLPWDKKPFDLRQYQIEAVDQIMDNWRGIINFATGLGKTLTAVHAIRKIKKKTLVVCPNVSIADNFYKELSTAFGENKVGYFGNNKKKIKDITVCIAQSAKNHIDKFKKHNLGLIIFDEVHHLAASTFYDISLNLGDVGRMYGLTATDFRSDGKDILITAGVGPVLIKRDLIWGIKNKWLADPYIIMRNIDTAGRDYSNDKIKNYKEHVLNNDAMNQRILNDCQNFLNAGKYILCLVNEVSHGKMIAEKLGVPFATGIDKKSDTYVEDLNNGKIKGLVGTDSKIGEGTDTKRVDVLILANFTASKGPLWQNLGRGLRIYGDKKNVIVLDYCPLGSKMLKRHGQKRLSFYKEITSNISVRN